MGITNIMGVVGMSINDLEIVKSIEESTGVSHSDEQLKILQHRGGMCILACAGSGKALKNGTGVLTPNGYIPIDSLNVGDICYDEKGQKQTIVGVYPQGRKEVCEVTFSDGSVIHCCEEHLWTYRTYGNNENTNRWCTDTLKNIMDNVPLKIEYKDKNGETQVKDNISIPMVKGVEFSKKELPLKPYLMGELLGDENTDESFIYKLEELGLKDEGNREKFIPEVYKLSSISDRVELFKGLLNTGGYYKRTNYELVSIYERLIDDAKFLVESLGMTAIKSIKTTRSKVNDTKEFRLLVKESDIRTIKSIEKTGELAEMTCIKVSGASGLFLTENCIVTHNTTILTHLLAKRILSGEITDTKRLLCTTFSKAGSSEMEDRLGTLFTRLGIRQKVQVSTLHASYYKVLKHFGLVGNVCTGGQRLKMVTDACRDVGLRNLSTEDLQLVDSLLSYQVNNLLSDDGLIKSYVYTLNDIEPDQYSNIRYCYNKMKEESGLIDFDDMQLYMYMLLVAQKKQEVISFCRGLWDYFFIDEFQDVSKIQFAILREMITDHNKLIVIGDDDQCIYQWRGADPNIILDICGYYDIQKFVLSTNYRCGGEIVKRAAKGIKNNVRRSEKEMIPYDNGGVIKMCDVGSDNLYEMSLYAHKYIKSLVDDGVNPDKIAVLSRNNQHVSLLNNMLFKSGIYCKTVPEMRMTNTPIYKDMKNLIRLSEPTYNYNVVASTMWKVCQYLGANNSKAIAELVRDGGLSVKDALGFIITKCTVYDCRIDWDKNVSIPPKVESKINQLFTACRDDVARGLVSVYKALDLKDRTERIVALSGLYLGATEFMNKSRDRTRTAVGFLEYLSVLLEDGVEDTESFLRLSEQYESGKMALMGPRINMSTIHGAKGKEWEHVIIFADDNVTFPSFEGIYKMVSDNVSMQDISGSIDENRRLHYVAMTRAKKFLTIFGDANNLSVYTLEALGALDKKDNVLNKHIIEMAMGGGITGELREASNKLFSQDSQYYMKVSLEEGEDE